MKILVINTQILAVDPIDIGDTYTTDDQIIPKHVAEGAKLVTVDNLPDDYSPGRYTYDNGFIKVVELQFPAAVPDTVTPRQIRQAMTRSGLRQDVEAAVAAGDQDLKDWWEFSTTYERKHPMVEQMAKALGVSDAQLDNIWILGDSL